MTRELHSGEGVTPLAPGQVRSQAQATTRTTLWVVLGSETIFFSTLLWAYLYLRAYQPGWPEGEAWLARLGLPLANTLALLASALAVYRGLAAIRRGRASDLLRWQGLGLALGLVFVGGQGLEWLRSGLHPGQGAGGLFLALMGFHALHVLAGAVLLGLVWARARLGDFNARRHAPVEAGAWFWAYVAAVWVVLFAALYLV